MMVRMGDSGTRTSCGPTVGRMTGNPGVGAAPWAAAVPAARTSARMMRPPGPVPVRGRAVAAGADATADDDDDDAEPQFYHF